MRRLLDAVLVAGLALALLAILAAAFTARVSGASMTPTIQDGDDVVVDKIGMQLRPPRRGDVVLATEGSAALVKRVIAVPGDVVEIGTIGQQPVVLLEPDGTGLWQRLVEPYVGANWRRKEFCCDSKGLDDGLAPRPLRIPPGSYFLLGDDRDASTDSRRWGLFSIGQIIGRVVFRWWPLSRAGPIEGRPVLVPA